MRIKRGQNIWGKLPRLARFRKPQEASAVATHRFNLHVNKTQTIAATLVAAATATVLLLAVPTHSHQNLSSSRTPAIASTFSSPPLGKPPYGNGLGPNGECTGVESDPPCGAGVVPSHYYPYTLPGKCQGLIIFNRKYWISQSPPLVQIPDVAVWIRLTTADRPIAVNSYGSVTFQSGSRRPSTGCLGLNRGRHESVP